MDNFSANYVGTAAPGRPIERSSPTSQQKNWSFRAARNRGNAAKAQRGICFSILALILLLNLACHHNPQLAAKRYPFKGRIIVISPQSQSAIIDGDAIPGFMDAMAMDYKIKPASALSQLASGDTITAEVVVIPADPKNPDAPPDYWLENVKVTSHGSAPTATPKSSLHIPAPGEDVPNFAFTNQNGRHISLDQYRGRMLFVTFIYTRCPFPDYCPRMSSNFAEIYNQLPANPALSGAHLLSISFDPQYDTPKILRAYGFSVAHTHEPALFNRWEFAVPTSADLPKVADFFALTIKPEGGLITHDFSTAIIGPNGKIVAWYHGSDWQVSDLIKDATSAAPKHG
jgi:protein SCO1